MLTIASTISAPATITIVVLRPTLSIDLTTVTGVTYNVLRRDGTTTQWAADIVASTPGELVTQYTFTGGSEITGTGVYLISPALTVPGGTIAVETIACMVDSPYAVQPQTETTGWLVATSTISSAGPVSNVWNLLTPTGSPYAVTRITPYLSLDLRTGAISATLWLANDGDTVVFSDVYAAASTDTALSITGAGSQLVPLGSDSPGQFGATGIFNTETSFPLTLKYSRALGRWLIAA